eukprot:365621-Chlamydomonas_euryale.AAC.3
MSKAGCGCARCGRGGGYEVRVLRSARCVWGGGTRCECGGACGMRRAREGEVWVLERARCGCGCEDGRCEFLGDWVEGTPGLWRARGHAGARCVQCRGPGWLAESRTGQEAWSKKAGILPKQVPIDSSV